MSSPGRPSGPWRPTASTAFDLLHRRHPGRDHERPPGRACLAQQGQIGQRGGGELVAGRLEVLHEVDRFFVPARGHPVDAEIAAMTVDLGVLLEPELDPVAVIDVGHPAPGRVALDVPLVRGDAELGVALLELRHVGPRALGAVDERLGVCERAVMVDADLRDDVDGLAVADLRPRYRRLPWPPLLVSCLDPPSPRAVPQRIFANSFHQLVNPPSTTRFAPVM